MRELRKTNGILTLASACFAPAELDRHHNTENDAISLPDARWRVKCFGTVTSVAGVAGVAGVGAGVRAGGQDMRAHALPDPGAANAGPGPVWCRMRTLTPGSAASQVRAKTLAPGSRRLTVPAPHWMAARVMDGAAAGHGAAVPAPTGARARRMRPGPAVQAVLPVRRQPACGRCR